MVPDFNFAVGDSQDPVPLPSHPSITSLLLCSAGNDHAPPTHRVGDAAHPNIPEHAQGHAPDPFRRQPRSRGTVAPGHGRLREEHRRVVIIGLAAAGGAVQHFHVVTPPPQMQVRIEPWGGGPSQELATALRVANAAHVRPPEQRAHRGAKTPVQDAAEERIVVVVVVVDAVSTHQCRLVPEIDAGYVVVLVVAAGRSD